MYPDINIESNSKDNINKLIKKIIEIKTYENNETIFKLRYRQDEKQVNLIFEPNYSKEEFLIFNNKKINIKDFGLEYGQEVMGTGYHIPEGVLLTYGNKSKEIFKDLRRIDTKLICPAILKLFNLKKKKYMMNLEEQKLD